MGTPTGIATPGPVASPEASEPALGACWIAAQLGSHVTPCWLPGCLRWFARSDHGDQLAFTEPDLGEVESTATLGSLSLGFALEGITFSPILKVGLGRSSAGIRLEIAEWAS